MNELEQQDARKAQEAVRGLGVPAADPAFRASLRARFADGSLAGDDLAAARALRPVVVRRPFVVRHGRLLGALAAAAVLAVYALVGFNPGPHWQVASLQDAHGNVIVDDDAIPADDDASLTTALVPGARIEWDGTGELMFVSPGALAIAVAPGTRMVLPAPPARFFDRVSRAQLAAGRLRITTGPDFHGARAIVTTPEAVAEVTGTTLAVIRDPMATCVCVSEGRVHVMRAGAPVGGAIGGAGDFGMVPAGQRQVVYRAGQAKAPERTPILPTEKAPLAALRAAMAPRWREASPAK